MKKFLIAIVTFCFFAMLPKASFAQCDAEKFMDNCNAKLANGYNFLKSFSIDGGKATSGKVEYSYVFSKDSNYLMTLCSKEGDAKKLVVTLFDANRKELGSNFDAKSNSFFPAFAYKCSATGIYYLSFSYPNGQGECAGSVLGFKRQ